MQLGYLVVCCNTVGRVSAGKRQTAAVLAESMQKWQRSLDLVDAETGQPNEKVNIGGYRNAKIWNPKSKFFDKPEEVNPPPECPMHKGEEQLEMDFNDKQRELTDLNWDGSESKKIDRD